MWNIYELFYHHNKFYKQLETKKKKLRKKLGKKIKEKIPLKRIRALIKYNFIKF